jgi:hypothetical protein
MWLKVWDFSMIKGVNHACFSLDLLWLQAIKNGANAPFFIAI